jgi:arylformamidase
MPAGYTDIIDLSHELYTGMPNVADQHIAFWPVETFEAQQKISGGKVGYESRMMLLAEHSGTHLDAPCHFHQGGLSVAQVPLDRLVLPGHLLDLRHKQVGESITIEDFREAADKTSRPIGPGTALVCWTGSDRFWGVGDDWKVKRPHVGTEAAQWLVDQGMTLFATDMIGMDDPAQWWWPTHKIWLQNNICMVQQLCNLEKLVGRDFLFLALPLKMREGTGCPVRAAALVL